MSLIDRYLRVKKNSDIKKPPRGAIYVTSIVKQCQRQAYFDIVRRTIPSIEKLRMFEAGNILEDYLVKVFNELDDIRVLGTQLPTYYYGNSFTVHGRLDILAQHDNSVIVCHEVKSTQNVPFTAPWSDHVEQLQFYLGALGIKWGQIDYLDRKALVMGEYKIDTSYEVIRDEDVFNNLIQRGQKLNEMLMSGMVPEANYESYGGKGCENCSHKAFCNELKVGSGEAALG